MGFGDGIGGNRPTLELLMQRPPALGKVFFVDSGGDNGNEGTDPAHPLDAITDALGKCTNSKGDVIVVMGLSPSTSEANETWPINMNKAGVLLTGLYSRGYLSDSGFGTDEADTATISLNANYITIENLYLGIKTGSTTADVITCAQNIYSFTLRNCLIECQYTARYGFEPNSKDCPYLLIEDNVFGGGGATINFTSAIRLWNVSNGGFVRRNMIKGCNGYAISILASCGHCNILDNDIACYADTDGYAIYAADGSSNNYINGNRCMIGIADTTNDPYWDANADDSNDWGVNYVGDDIEYPSNS